MKATIQGKIQRTTKPSSREISAAIALKLQARALYNERESFSVAETSDHYCAQFSRVYDAVALDFDGTLVSLLSRTSMPSARLIKAIGALLERGIPLVVISGRGDSLLGLGTVLSTFDQESLFLAMYNGSRIVRGPNCSLIVDKKMSLRKIFLSLRGNRTLASFAKKWTLKDYTIQAIPKKKSGGYIDAFCRQVAPLVPETMIVKNSGYALDVYPRGCTKERCLEIISDCIGRDLRFLRIGDQGHRFGNDYELLNSNGGFSVGTISGEPRVCFPAVSSNGKFMKGPMGTHYILSKVFGFA